MDSNIPQIEWDPPYSSRFLAHLRAGCYDDDLGNGIVWQRAMADPPARAFLDALSKVDSDFGARHQR